MTRPLRNRDAELVLLHQIGNHRHIAEAQHHRAGLLAALGRDDDATAAAASAVAAARESGDAEFLAMVGNVPGRPGP
jgi:predicted RNA polymerase sigma factor